MVKALAQGPTISPDRILLMFGMMQQKKIITSGISLVVNTDLIISTFEALSEKSSPSSSFEISAAFLRK